MLLFVSLLTNPFGSNRFEAMIATPGLFALSNASI